MIQDKAIEPTAAIRLMPIDVPIITATSQTGVLAAATVPGFAFEIEKVEVYASAVTATISADVQIGAASVLTGAATPVAGSIVNGTLVASRAARRGSASSAINVRYTTNGSGAATNLRVRVWVRPYPLNGEA